MTIEIARTIEHVVGAIHAAAERRDPFHHMRFAGVFPPDVYSAMLDAMPEREDYSAMSGRARLARGADGGNARTKIDLFPECTIRLPTEKRAVWTGIGEVLRSAAVRDACVRRLAPALERRFGARYRTVGMYPVPILTRDVPKP